MILPRPLFLIFGDAALGLSSTSEDDAIGFLDWLRILIRCFLTSSAEDMVCASGVLVVVSVVVVVAGAFVVVVVGTVTGAGVVVGCLGRWEIGIPG